MSRLIALSLIALALSAPLAVPAATAEAPKVVFVTVAYGDLDVDTPAGARTLLSRINTAAKKVCGKAPATLMLSVPDKRAECRATVIRETVQRIGEPGLTLAWQRGADVAIQTAAR